MCWITDLYLVHPPRPNDLEPTQTTELEISRALETAISLGDAETRKRLLEQGANPNKSMSGCMGCASLFKALHPGHSDIASLLIKEGVGIHHEACVSI